jgi:hypothetical protein
MQYNGVNAGDFAAEMLAQLSLHNSDAPPAVSSTQPSAAAAAAGVQPTTAAATGRKRRPALTVSTGFGSGGMSTSGKFTCLCITT